MFERLKKIKNRLHHRWIYALIAGVYLAAFFGLDKATASLLLAGLYLLLAL